MRIFISLSCQQVAPSCYRKNAMPVQSPKTDRGRVSKTRKSTVGLIVLEPRTSVKCVLCRVLLYMLEPRLLVECVISSKYVGFLHLISIFFLAKLHRADRAGLSAGFQVVATRLRDSVYIEIPSTVFKIQLVDFLFVLEFLFSVYLSK